MYTDIHIKKRGPKQMSLAIEKILKKKKPTGEDVGKALVLSVIHDIKHQGEQDFKPLFTQKEFDRIEQALATEEDYFIYGCYKDIYRSIISTYGRCEGMQQQYFNGLSQWQHKLNVCYQDLSNRMLESEAPVIMTQSQYTRLKAKTEKELKNNRESLYSLFFKTLEYFLDNPSGTPSKITECLEKASKEPITNKRVAEGYKNYCEGYYKLKDGPGSDQMTQEKWEQLIGDIYTGFFGIAPKKVDGQVLTSVLDMLKEERNFKGEKAFYGCIEREELILALEEKIIKDKWPLDKIIEQVEPTQEELAMGKIIEDITDLGKAWNIYPKILTKFSTKNYISYYNGHFKGVSEEQQLKEFEEDHKELFNEVLSYMADYIPSIREINTLSLWHEEIISWGKLAEYDFINFKDHILPLDIKIISTYIEELKDGGQTSLASSMYAKKTIAILQNTTAENYIPKIQDIALERLSKNTEEVCTLEAYMELFIEGSIIYIYAFNHLLDILAKAYNITELETLSFNTCSIEDATKKYNKMLYGYYGFIQGDEEGKANERKLFNDIFKPINLEEYKPKQGPTKAVIKKLKEIGFNREDEAMDTIIKNLKNFDLFIEEIVRWGGKHE